jgi:receptor-binding and translocation channel-forming TcA subunit of Tc toxin
MPIRKMGDEEPPEERLHGNGGQIPPPPPTPKKPELTTPLVSGPPVSLRGSRKHTVVKEWHLSYSFYTHFHPYAAELVNRLIEGSVRGLQDSDTEWGTPAKLSMQTEAKLLDSQSVTLPKDEEIRLPDGTSITLSDGTSVKLSGNSVIKVSDGLSSTLPDNAQGTIPPQTLVKRLSEERVILHQGAPIVMLSKKPRLRLYEEFFTHTQYAPNGELVPNTENSPHPVKDLDFDCRGAYSIYNWELFYHAPVTIAIHLSKNQRYAEAMQWFHYVFDPTDNSEGPTPERFWKVKPFQNTDVRMIEERLFNLSLGADSRADRQLQKETIESIVAWKNSPFSPHAVARFRQSAYMLKTVMAYLDNLIAWGDFLFRQDTRETINEATQLYVLAANILGPLPQAVPKKGSVRPQTYANLRKDLDLLGNALSETEPNIPFDFLPYPGQATDNDRVRIHESIGKSLYFCVPRNDKLLSYWDTVADRLFKIRNSLNIQGIFRHLPLFEPPIDPALLARAAAAGLDIGAIISGLNQPLPLVRFQFLVQKAAEICQEVKSLGNNLLSAIEKEDNEALAILRATHERVIMEMAEIVRYGQLQEATKAREGLEKSLANAVQRYKYYQRLLGMKEEEIKVPDLGPIDTSGLEQKKLNAGEPEVPLHEIKIDIAQSVGGVSEIKTINSHELEEFNRLKVAIGLQDQAATMEAIGSFLALIPEIASHATPVGVGAALSFGGKAISTMLSMVAGQNRAAANRASYEANKAAKIGSYVRREQEWAYQSNLAVGEINQIFKQLRAAQIREAVAEREWINHQQQIRHAEEIERFLKGEKNSSGHRKISTKGFYAWMKREVKGLYGQVFQFAFDVAKKAERALQHELGDTKLSFLQFGYLAGKEGLLAGEKLYLDIKRMEMAYHDLNQREYELIKHVSLLQVDPLALVQLRATGSCTVSLPEPLFDMDCPGHYFRRIKFVAVSIPCVTGPYTSINCRLTLLKSSIRISPQLGEEGYARAGADDSRFSDHFGSLQSIFTSTGLNDTGMFETNLRDERYLPFEGAGTISQWQLELPADPSQKGLAQFDYNTISDVILHLRFTAREGGGLLRNEAIKHIEELMTEAQAVGSVRLFSVRHEFPTEWAKFLNQTPVANKRYELTLDLRPEHYPFWSQGRLNGVTRVDILARYTTTRIPGSIAIFDKNDATAAWGTVTKVPALGDLLVGRLAEVAGAVTPTRELKLFFDDKAMADLWIAMTWNE